MEKLPDPNTYGKKIAAIIYCKEKQVNGKQFLKYNYVDNNARGLQSFINFARNFPGATHINFYCKTTYQLIEQFKY